MTNLPIEVKPLYLYDSVTSQPITLLIFTAEQVGMENNGFIYATTATANLSDSTYPRYTDYKTAANSSQGVTICNGIISAVNADDSASYFTTFSLEYVDSTTQDAVNVSIAAISIDSIADGSTYKKITAAEKTKLDGLVGAQSYDNITQKIGAFPIYKSGSIASGTLAIHFTADGTSTGTALFPNGPITNSVNVIFNDAASSYQCSWAWSNSNKTLTITANKLSTANILTGILGQAAANGSVATASVWGN